MTTGEVRSLWDVEDEDSFPPVREMMVGPVSASDVSEFCGRYHYTGLGNNAHWRYGLWSGVVLLGVVAYNLPTRSTCVSVFGEEHLAHVWHMTRLVLPDAVPHNAESRLIGGSLALIRREYPHVWAVVTYAATDVGHLGYVYQATNAIYTGLGGHLRYWTDATGSRRAEHLGGVTVGTREIEAGWTRHVGGLKHRYVYILGSRTQRKARRALLKYDVLPYPKPIDDGAA